MDHDLFVYPIAKELGLSWGSWGPMCHYQVCLRVDHQDWSVNASAVTVIDRFAALQLSNYLVAFD